LRVAHVVSDDIAPEHLRTLSVLARAGGSESLAVVDHGSPLRQWLANGGLVTECAALSPRTRRRPAFQALTDLFWERNLDAVHIHGAAVAPLAVVAARWLDLPIVFTPALADSAPVRRPLRQRIASFLGRDVVRRADGIMLIDSQGEAASFAPGGRPDRPLLRVAPSADPALAVARYRDLLARIDARIGRVAVAAPRARPQAA